MIYDLSPEGIYLNIFNKNDKYDMILVPWENIEKCEVDYLSFPNVLGSERDILRRRMLKDFKEVKRVHNGFHYSTDIVHREKTGIKLYLKNGRFDYLPLPVTWKEIAEKKRFIDELEKYVSVEEIEHKEIQLLDLFKKSGN